MSIGHPYKFFGFCIYYTILTSPCLFCTYHLCYLFPVPFPPFPPFNPLHPALPPPFTPTPQFMSMGRTYNFFGFPTSYTILNLSLSILYLQFLLPIPCTFPPFSPLTNPTDNPPCDLHFCDPLPVLVVCLDCFYFSFIFCCFFFRFSC